MKTILAPIDFSAASDHVVAAALGLARAIQGRLVLLHVIPPSPRLGGDAALAECGAEFTLQVETDAHRRLTLLQEELRAAGVAAHAVLRNGPPGQCIVRQAERLSADYIVIGSHGHTAFYDLIVGSTTSRVLKEVTCRVVVVPRGVAFAGRPRNSLEDQRGPPGV